MNITKIGVRNFRLLHNVILRLEDAATVIVGRNNCGKTSLADVIRKFLNEAASFEIEDFSSACYDEFRAAYLAWRTDSGEDVVRRLLPAVELRIHVGFDVAIPDYGPLQPLVIDFDDDCKEVILVCERVLSEGAIKSLFEGTEELPTTEVDGVTSLTAEGTVALFKALRERTPKLFKTRFWAQDPTDAANTKELTQAEVGRLLSCGFINAQRGLDGQNARETDILAKVLENLFHSASLPNADGDQKSIAEGLTKAVEEIQEKIDQDFKLELGKLMPTIESFAYDGLTGPPIQTETRLDVRRLLSNHTRVQYAGYGGVQLPESYNGLGFRNLLFILLQIVGFYRWYRAQTNAPAVHLVFIEEPEAHLHPQMQEVFIRHLNGIAQKLSKADGGKWPVQFVVSTHSSHVANEARFDAIRYFVVSSKGRPVGVRCTEVKDLREGLADQKPENAQFLHQYLTLTRCDLFFADKAVLIEGTSERLLLPSIVKKMDAENDKLKLSSRYTTIMEVGGAYAYLFFPLIDFLELPTLVITDIDSGRRNANKKLVACDVSEGATTSNATIKRWFAEKGEEVVDEPEGDEAEEGDTAAGDPVVEKLPLAKVLQADVQKRTQGLRHLAYQRPESDRGPCGRSFEEAFMLANPAKFCVVGKTVPEREKSARLLAGKVKKSRFALTYAIEQTEWSVPRYIREGLEWLAGDDVATVDPGLALVAQAAPPGEAAKGVGGLPDLPGDKG